MICTSSLAKLCLRFRKLNNDGKRSSPPLREIILTVRVLADQQVTRKLIFGCIRTDDTRHPSMAFIAEVHRHPPICFDVADPVGAIASAGEQIQLSSVFREPDLDAVRTSSPSPERREVKKRFGRGPRRPGRRTIVVRSLRHTCELLSCSRRLIAAMNSSRTAAMTRLACIPDTNASRWATNAPNTATAMAPPSCRDVFSAPLAVPPVRPARCQPAAP